MKNNKWSDGLEYKKSLPKDKPILDSKNQQFDIPLNKEVINNKFKREEYLLELTKRNNVIRTTLNPFLKKTYNEVILDQEKFLIPQNSNFE